MYHPELEKQNYKLLKVKPNYDYRVNIDVVVTNLFDREVRRKLTELIDGESRHICVFFNSTAGIIKVLDNNRDLIGDDYMVFASKDAIPKLHPIGITNVEPDFKLPLKKYNFFTSRFFSAFDIELKLHKPDILILTDLKTAKHSTIDPLTEAIQIQGRFREPDPKTIGYWFNSLTHIHNYNENLKVATDTTLDARITEFEITHSQIKERLDDARSLDSFNAISED